LAVVQSDWLPLPQREILVENLHFRQVHHGNHRRLSLERRDIAADSELAQLLCAEDERRKAGLPVKASGDSL